MVGIFVRLTKNEGGKFNIKSIFYSFHEKWIYYEMVRILFDFHYLTFLLKINVFTKSPTISVFYLFKVVLGRLGKDKSTGLKHLTSELVMFVRSKTYYKNLLGKFL